MMKTAGASARPASRWMVKALAAVADGARPAGPGIPVLAYHRVGGRSPVDVDLPTALFAEQMEILRTEHRVVSLDVALEELRAPGPTASDTVVVTFDDGTADFVDAALPILVRHSIPVTLYVATDFLERQQRFPNDGVPLSWTALGDAVSTGLVTVGSHTHTHALFDRLTVEQAENEVTRSKDLIGDRVGVPADHFAFPKGVSGSLETECVVRRRFTSAALGGTRINRYGATDPFRLARSPVQASDGIAWFRRKVAGGMALEDSLRRALNRVRYAGAVT